MASTNAGAAAAAKTNEATATGSFRMKIEPPFGSGLSRDEGHSGPGERGWRAAATVPAEGRAPSESLRVSYSCRSDIGQKPLQTGDSSLRVTPSRTTATRQSRQRGHGTDCYLARKRSR